MNESNGKVRVRFQLWELVTAIRELLPHSDLPPKARAIAPRRRDVLRRNLGALGRKAARFAEQVEAERPQFESHYADNRLRLIAWAREIICLLQPGDDDAMFRFACAALRANRRRAAMEMFEALHAMGPNLSANTASATRRLARAAWVQGESDRALALIRSVKGRAASDQYRSWLGELGIRNSLMLLERGELNGAGEMLLGGLKAKGLEEQEARDVARIYLATLDDDARPLPVPELPPTPQAVLLAGFGWSGSGAISDFLKGCSCVDDVFKGREIGFWTGKYGLDRVYGHVLRSGFNRRIVLEFLARHCFGHNFLAGAKGTKNPGGAWALLKAEDRHAFMMLLHRWVLAARTAEPEQLLLASRQLSSGLLALLAREGTSHAVLSNCVTSNSIAAARMFESPAVIVSWRDPADAYASKRAAFPDNNLDFSAWERQLKSRIEAYLEGKREAVEHAGTWMDVAFEDFVSNDRLRADILAALGVNASDMQESFDPDVSSRNIGIGASLGGDDWKRLSHEIEQARLAAAAMNRTVTGAVRRASGS